jgi:hypothetical protein
MVYGQVMRSYCCLIDFCDDGIPLSTIDYKPGGKMKLDTDDNKFVTYLMIGMMGLGFVVMLLL